MSLLVMVLGAAVGARLDIDERETTRIVLDIVAVAQSNGLKLPREFGLLLKQVLLSIHTVCYLIRCIGSVL
jgi:hypothetical protein